MKPAACFAVFAFLALSVAAADTLVVFSKKSLDQYALTDVSGAASEASAALRSMRNSFLVSAPQSDLNAINKGQSSSLKFKLAKGVVFQVVVRATLKTNGANLVFVGKQNAVGKGQFNFPDDFVASESFTTRTSEAVLKSETAREFFAFLNVPNQIYVSGLSDTSSKPRLGWLHGLANQPHLVGIAIPLAYVNTKLTGKKNDKAIRFLKMPNPSEAVDSSGYSATSWTGYTEDSLAKAPPGDYLIGLDVYPARNSLGESDTVLYNRPFLYAQSPVHLGILDATSYAYPASYLLKNGETLRFSNDFKVSVVDVSSTGARLSVQDSKDHELVLIPSNGQIYSFGKVYSVTLPVDLYATDVKVVTLSMEVNPAKLGSAFMKKYRLDEKSLPASLGEILRSYVVVTLKQSGPLSSSVKNPRVSTPGRQPPADQLKSYGSCNAYVYRSEIRPRSETLGFRLDTVSGTCQQACGSGQTSGLSWAGKKTEVLTLMQQNGYEVTINGAPYDYSSPGVTRDKDGKPYVKLIQECPDQPSYLQCCTAGPTQTYQILYPKTDSSEFQSCNAFKDASSCYTARCDWNDQLQVDPTSGEKINGGCRPRVS